MPNEAPESLDREQRLDEAVTAFLEAQEAGRHSQREEWLARYPEVAAELAQFFADQDEVDRLTVPLRTALQGTPPPGDTPQPSQPDDASAPVSPSALAAPPEGYELLQVLGQGGMGLVYKARQKSAGRFVALKLIRAERLTSAADVQRFRNEAEAAAQLDHPHIVSVYEVGARPGHFFFSMKLIEGGGLDEQLDRFRDDPHGAARLVAQVARAVHHAHQRGILHRDLKPSNILLDRDGQPHVSDFGLAKRIEADASLTQTGAIVGTPQYMALEQTRSQKGAVTTATDVYGLGAVLYALLAGRPPFQGETVLETLEQVREREPEPPRQINPKVDRDLETICLKCLQKEPQRRYESAQALAEDLERWLAGEPILARPLSRRARFWRWCRRNRLIAALSVTVILLVFLAVAGLAIGTWLLWRERGQTQAALAEARSHHARAEDQRQRAEFNCRDAFWAFEDVLCALDPARSARPVTVAELKQWQTERALQFLAILYNDPSEDPSNRFMKAGAWVHTGRVYQVRGERDKAHQAFQQAVADYRKLIQDFPENSGYPSTLSRAIGIMAENRYEAGQFAEANLYYQQAVDAWRDDVQKHPTHTGACLELANLLCNWFDPQLRDPVAALEYARRAVNGISDDPRPYQTLGLAYYRNGRWDAALGALQKALQWPEVPSKWAWTHTLHYLAMTHWQLGRREEAVREFRQAQERMKKTFRTRDVWDRAIRKEAATLLGIKEPPPFKVEEEPLGRN